MASKVEAIEAFALLDVFYPRAMNELYPPKSKRRAAFIRVLARYPGPTLANAIDTLTSTKTTLFPNDSIPALIAEIASKANPKAQDPEEVIDWILQTMERRGSRYDDGWPTPEIESAVRHCGGWFNLCSQETSEVHRRLGRVQKMITDRGERERIDSMRTPETLTPARDEQKKLEDAS